MVSKRQGRKVDANTGVWQYAAYANTLMDHMHRMRGERGVPVNDQGGGAGDASTEAPMVYQVCPSQPDCDVGTARSLVCSRLRVSLSPNLTIATHPCRAADDVCLAHSQADGQT